MQGNWDQDALKREAANRAADRVRSGMVVGLGTGSTAAFMIERLIERSREGLDIVCIPTSERSAAQARAGGLRLVDFSTHPEIDITIDGADEIERGTLHLIKGLGGALLREKIVACASKTLIIIADDSKLVTQLGVRTPVPVEVTQFGWHATQHAIAGLGGVPKLRLTAQQMPYVTDGGNYIMDAKFEGIADPSGLARSLTQIPGVVETGIFPAMTSAALIASPSGVVELIAS